MSSKNIFSVDDLLKNSDRSNTSILAQIIDQIELAITAGISHEQIINDLTKKEIVNFTLPAFKLALYRVRKRRDKNEKIGAKTHAHSAKSEISPSPAINSKESPPIISSSTGKMSLQEIKQQTPGLTAKERRVRHADQYFNNYMHPYTRALLEKK